MKILMINPPVDVKEETFVIPLGLGYIASVLKNHHDVTVIDLRTQPNYDFINASREADVVAISATILSAKSCGKILSIVKEVNPNVVTVVGGPYATADPEKAMINENIDVVVLGEGENTAVELFQTLENNDELSNVKGIGFRRNKEVYFTPPREPINDLDNIPFPAFELFPLEKYSGYNPALTNAGKTGSIITSRGCPFRCIYCFQKTFGNRWRARSPENVVEEWAYQVENLKIKKMTIIDDCFNLNVERAIKICTEIIKRKLNIPWSAPQGMRADRLPLKLLDIMKDSGCFRIGIGVENSDQEYLNKVVKKNLDLSKVKIAVKYCKEIGIETLAFFILGLPQETKETMQRTIEFAKELDADFAMFQIANPFPGTELFNIVQRDGLMLKEVEDFSGYVDNRANFEMGELNSKLLIKMRKKAYWSYYMRPKYYKKIFSDPGNILKGGYYLLKRMVTGI